MKEDSCYSIILRTTFLATVGTIINVKNCTLLLLVRDEKIKFYLPKAIVNLTFDESYCKVDALEKLINKEAGI